MSKHLNKDGLGNHGVCVSTFAERLGISKRQVISMCRRGRIAGARKHPITRDWWIYPPALLVPK